MFKGIGKNVVILKNTNSEIFEEAIFILKEGKSANNKDILKECEKIIDINLTSDYKKHSKTKSFIKISLVSLIVLISLFSILLILNLL